MAVQNLGTLSELFWRSDRRKHGEKVDDHVTGQVYVILSVPTSVGFCWSRCKQVSVRDTAKLFNSFLCSLRAETQGSRLTYRV